MKVKDSVVLVTGANRGIGKAYAEECLKAGAKKIYLAVRNLETVRAFAATQPEHYIPLALDVTQPDQIQSAAKTAKDVNILINNAGVLFSNTLLGEKTIEEARMEMEVNYFGPLMLSRAFAPVLKANGGGCIATVSSIAGHLSFPGFPTYCASKAAAHSLIQSLRIELADQGTHIIGVYPGPIDTDMARDIHMDKFPPAQVAQETIKAIDSGVEDVFPDAMSLGLSQDVLKDPKAVERQMLDIYRSLAQAA